MKILDLFCCNGVGAIGYKIAFPDAEITGVDTANMSSCYPFFYKYVYQVHIIGAGL